MLRRAIGNVELDLSVAAISNCYCDRPKVGAVLLVSAFCERVHGPAGTSQVARETHHFSHANLSSV